MSENYLNVIGKTFEFKKGEKAPQWMWKHVNAEFGVDVIVKPEKERVLISPKEPITDYILYFGKIAEGETIEQLCPNITYMWEASE